MLKLLNITAPRLFSLNVTNSRQREKVLDYMQEQGNITSTEREKPELVNLKENHTSSFKTIVELFKNAFGL